jgi:cell division septation protein DedD
VQVAATPYRDRGQELVSALRKQGFDAYLGKRKPFVIRVRPGPSESPAQTAARLERLGHATHLVAE